ncbi:MAG: HAD-IB family hydrolase [Candidatus Aenigmatarchaeota archaeon]
MKESLNDNSLRNAVLSILTTKHPLSARELYEIIRCDHVKLATYPAVYKTLKVMTRENKLIKQNRNFSININWVKELKTFAERVEDEYVHNMHLPTLDEIKNNENFSITFNTFDEANIYRKKLQKEYFLKKDENKPYCTMSRHQDSPLITSEKPQNLLNIMSDTKTKLKSFVIVAGNTLVDEWTADYYRNRHIAIQTGLPVADKCNIMVFGDVVMQIYLPEIVKNYIDKIYSKTTDISEINVEEFIRNAHKIRAKTKVIIMKNPVIAEQIRNQVINYFKRDRIAIFDVNDCLVDGFLIVEFSRYLAEKRIINEIDAKKIEDIWNMYKKGKTNFDSASNTIIDHYALAVKGVNLTKLKKTAEEFVNEGNVQLFSYSRRLFTLMASYMRTLIITKMPLELVESLKSIFPFQSALSTILEVKNNKLTGNIAKNLSGQERKVTALKAWFAQNCVDMNNSIGFGDSHHDLAFLNMVNIPVALNPSPQLEKIAKKNNWLIHKSTDSTDILLKKMRNLCKN